MNISINKIKGNPNNPRLIKTDKFRKLVVSIRETPEMMSLRPIITDENDIILGGNMRWKACKELGWKDIPVDKYTRERHKDSDSWKVYNKTYEKVCEEILIKDNSHYGEFDMDILANTFEPTDLDAYGVDVWQPEEELKEEKTSGGIAIDFNESDYHIAKELLSSIKDRGEYIGTEILELLMDR